jgi:RimJ/RimL family protein N-acetyltransferase
VPATRRLALRPIAADDRAVLLALFRDPGVRRYLLDDTIVDAAWIAREIAASDELFAQGELGLFTARDRGDGRLIGVAGFRLFAGPSDPQLLYALAPGTTGRGYAAEMVAAVVEMAFDLGAPRVVATVDEPNVGSLRLLERLGFRLVAELAGARFPMRRYQLLPGEGPATAP